LDIVSTESGRPEAAVPSFGDLFDDPEPGAETPTAPSYDEVHATTGEIAAVVGDQPAPVEEPSPAEEPEVDVPVAPAGVAGFEAQSEEPAAPAPTPARAPIREPEPMDVVPAVVSTAAPAVTGRLYRSAGAEGPATDGAIPAIDPEYLAARDAQRAAEAAAAAKAKPAKKPATQGGSGLTWSGVVVVVMLGTILVAFADALINDSLGIITGIALLVSSVYCALLVRPADIWAAAIIPPLAFLAATLTAGQLTLDSAGSLVVREGYMILKTLAQNAPWIVGTTIICFVIVLVRRRRAAAQS
jgi:hypothetical protein